MTALRTACLSLFAVLTGFALPALAADPFTVAKVPVDGRGNSAIEAQTQAIQAGYIRAANTLFDRLTLESERQNAEYREGWIGGLPELTPAIVGPLIRGQSIENERRSNRQYLGDVTIAFNPSAVQQFLRRAELTMVSSQARERLVIPTGVSPSSPLMGEINSGRFAHALVPLKTASQADADQFYVNPSEAVLNDIARRNNVGTIMLISEGNSGRLSVREISLDGQGDQNYVVSGGMSALSAQLDRQWKATSAVPSSSATSATVSVLYNSLADWQYLQQAINTSAQIRDARLDAISKDGALMSLTYGQLDRLQAEMRQKGVRVESDPALGLVIRR